MAKAQKKTVTIAIGRHAGTVVTILEESAEQVKVQLPEGTCVYPKLSPLGVSYFRE